MTDDRSSAGVYDVDLRIKYVIYFIYILIYQSSPSQHQLIII